MSIYCNGKDNHFPLQYLIFFKNLQIYCKMLSGGKMLYMKRLHRGIDSVMKRGKKVVWYYYDKNDITSRNACVEFETSTIIKITFAKEYSVALILDICKTGYDYESFVDNNDYFENEPDTFMKFLKEDVQRFIDEVMKERKFIDKVIINEYLKSGITRVLEDWEIKK